MAGLLLVVTVHKITAHIADTCSSNCTAVYRCGKNVTDDTGAGLDGEMIILMLFFGCMAARMLDVAYCYRCSKVCVSVGHNLEPCKSG